MEYYQDNCNGKELCRYPDDGIRVYDFNNPNKKDSEIIADCLSFCAGFSHRTIIFDQKDWYIDEAIILLSNTTVIIDGCKIKQNNGVFDNVFRGNNLTLDESDPYGFPLNVDEIKNIEIIGLNNATIEGPDMNKVGFHPVLNQKQEMIGDFWGWRTLQISLSRCTNFRIGNINFTKTRCWGVSFDKCSNGYIHDLTFDSHVKNGDGVDIRAGCRHIKVARIKGFTSDDTVACTALGFTGESLIYPRKNYIYPLEPTKLMNRNLSAKDLSIHDIDISGVYTGGHCHGVICLASDGLQVYNISINDIQDGTEGARQATVKIYTGYGTGYSDNDLHNIRLNHITSKISKHTVECNAKVDNIWCNNLMQKNPEGELTNISYKEGITITNS